MGRGAVQSARQGCLLYYPQARDVQVGPIFQLSGSTSAGFTLETIRLYRIVLSLVAPMPLGITSPSHSSHPTFVELPPFERCRETYLNDEEYRVLQAMLLDAPDIGDVISGTGGLRKVRYEDRRRGKGKRSGMRIIYYFWVSGQEFWMFTVYNKGEVSDLSSAERKAFKILLENELQERNSSAKQKRR